MGKSAASCFKIITCGGDSVDQDDLQTAESKGSSDRRGWSFRKRSSRHRVLSNNVISETPSAVNKENPESTIVNFQVQPDLNVPEKTSVVLETEHKAELSAQVDTKISDTIAAKEDDCGANATLDESSIIIIQAAIRGWLAQRVLLKQKSIIKLQAAVRGHIVRRYAIGTLRCVQAIIKMQALVRARRTRLAVEGSGDFVKQGESGGKDNNDPTLLSKKEAKPNSSYTYVSTEKLLNNAFIHQLMESTPRTKPINIKCEPLKSDLAWRWLERWMSVSSVTIEEQVESGSAVEQEQVESGSAVEQEQVESGSAVEQEQVESGSAVEKELVESGSAVEKEQVESGSAVEQHEENIRHSDGKKNILVPSDHYAEPADFSSGAAVSADFSSGAAVSAEVSENDDNSINYDTNDLDPSSFTSISPSSSHSKLHNIDQSNSRLAVTESAPDEIEETGLIGNVDVKSLPEEEINEQDEPDWKRFSTEQPETEAKKFLRKASNPAFIAAQSKFEELSSSSTSAKLPSSSICDPGVESSLDKVSSANQSLRSRDNGLVDGTISNASAVQIGGSECGTELSISSTLDSPDRLEAGVNDIKQETKVSDKADYPRSGETLELEANGKARILEADPSLHTSLNKLERHESLNSSTDECLDSVTAADLQQLEKKPEAEPALGSEASHPLNKSSPEASPRSHITPQESQATPSFQVSFKPKKNKGEKSESNRKNMSSSADKKSLSSCNQDSASRSSSDQLQVPKTGKRRNSLGSVKPDHREHEPRESSCSNSLPSYMQATESARAKAIANGSPRSSPDVHDKDTFVKKRHSLPSSNERQGSPHIQRSLSLAQQNAKGNGTHSPQDRRWRR